MKTRVGTWSQLDFWGTVVLCMVVRVVTNPLGPWIAWTLAGLTATVVTQIINRRSQQ